MTPVSYVYISGMGKMLSDSSQKVLDDLLAGFERDAKCMIGYPSTQIVDFSPLFPFLDYFINNIGDPNLPSNFRLNTHKMEREVISWIKSMLRAGDRDIWGYVTGGGTEGNMYGIYLARELFPNGIVYYSEDTHYSVAKVLRMVNARSIMIKSVRNGEIDYADLAATLAVHRDVPPVIFANIGTTMRGAIDDIGKIRNILKDLAIPRYYIHADAALSGMILPFVDDPQPFGFDAGIDSIAISGHKMPGTPVPCGVVLARKEHVNRISRAVEYIGTADATVAGSRSGLSVLFLWYEIMALGVDGFREIVAGCMEVAEYAVQKFLESGVEAWRHKNSPIVVFPRCNESVLKKWQIATQGSDAHIITMPHVKKVHIDMFIKEYLSMMDSRSEEAA